MKKLEKWTFNFIFELGDFHFLLSKAKKIVSFLNCASVLYVEHILQCELWDIYNFCFVLKNQNLKSEEWIHNKATKFKNILAYFNDNTVISRIICNHLCNKNVLQSLRLKVSPFTHTVGPVRLVLFIQWPSIYSHCTFICQCPTNVLKQLLNKAAAHLRQRIIFRHLMLLNFFNLQHNFFFYFHSNRN